MADLTSAIAVWGAALSTGLGVLEVVRQFSERPKVTLYPSIGVATPGGYMEATVDRSGTIQASSWEQQSRLAAAGSPWAFAIRVVNTGRRPTTVAGLGLQTSDGNFVEDVQFLPGSQRLPARLDENEGRFLLIDAKWLFLGLESERVRLTGVRCTELTGHDTWCDPPRSIRGFVERIRQN